MPAKEIATTVMSKMIEVVDHCYDFLMDLCSSDGDDIIENLKLRDELPGWNEPKLLAFRHF
jgi:hypothetical protein